MKILILALGNDLAGEDIAGFLVADKLLKALDDDLKRDVNVIKSSETGFKLIDYLLDHHHIIIIDSMISDKSGEIIRVSTHKFRSIRSIPSLHMAGIPDLIYYIERLGIKRPDVEIYTITIKDTNLGAKVSKPVLDAVDRLFKLILKRVYELLSINNTDRSHLGS